MATQDIFVFFLAGSRAPLGAVMSQADVDAVYSHLPEGVTVQRGRAVESADGGLYTVALGPLSIVTAESLASDKATKKSALAKLSEAEIDLLGLEWLKTDVNDISNG